MKYSICIVLILSILTRAGEQSLCIADDLDDGIPIDDSISEYDQIGDSIDPNYAYLSLRVQSDVAARLDNNDEDPAVNEGSFLNSVILQAGATVQGDIIIIDQSQGDKTIIAQ